MKAQITYAGGGDPWVCNFEEIADLLAFREDEKNDIIITTKERLVKIYGLDTSYEKFLEITKNKRQYFGTTKEGYKQFIEESKERLYRKYPDFDKVDFVITVYDSCIE